MRKYSPGMLRSKKRSGYVILYVSHGGKDYRIGPEHRIVMEHELGRPLRAEETVHHKNGIRHDNRPDNLEVRGGQHGPGPSHCPHCGLPLYDNETPA